MFNLDNSTPAASSANFLKKNTIHDVIFKGAELAQVGKEVTQQVVRINFEGVEDGGTHSETLFEPKKMTREVGSLGYESPSDLEQFQIKLRQYVAAINPELDKKINEGANFGAASWDAMSKLIVDALNGAKNKNVGTKTQLKLLANSQGYAQAPGYPAGLAKPKDGEASRVYPKTKFVGDNLSFNPKEETQIAKSNNANATNMDSVSTPAQSDDIDVSSFNIDDL